MIPIQPTENSGPVNDREWHVWDAAKQIMPLILNTISTRGASDAVVESVGLTKYDNADAVAAALSVKAARKLVAALEKSQEDKQ